MNVNMSGTDVDYIDPSLAYGTISLADLDSRLRQAHRTTPTSRTRSGPQIAPDGAAGFPAVSKDGKTYTFTIKSGIKSNTGATLTAANFAAAINRDLNPKMQSPAAPFITATTASSVPQAVARRQGQRRPAA